MSPIPDVGQHTIPLFIGTVLNWALLGVLVVQVCLYFLAFSEDLRISKILVVFVALAEIAQTLGDSRNTVRTFGAGWGNLEAMDDVGWAWLSVPILGSLIAAVGQIFFAWRIYIISKKKICVPVLVAIVTTIQLGAGIWTGVLIVRAGKFSRLEFAHLKPPIAWLSATAASDLIIVLGTVFYVLKAKQPEFRTSTQAALSRIVKAGYEFELVTVETGLLCAISAGVDLYLFVAFDGNNYHLAACIWLSKVYSNSILAILNSRAYIGHTSPDITARLSDMVFHSKAPESSVHVSIETHRSNTSHTVQQSYPSKYDV
ncbi:hypothetical protein C8R43DRAFT_1114969 [Mycena crocata]|nr:hypothetical protein C8R43DRAFT_1114969 [Mycena crocata]